MNARETLVKTAEKTQGAFMRLAVDQTACGIAFITAGILLIAMAAYQSRRRHDPSL